MKKIILILALLTAFVPAVFAAESIDIEETEIIETCVQEVSVQKTRTAENEFGPEEFSETIEYEQDGFTGILTRDDSSFEISAYDVKTVKKPIVATKKYILARNDMAEIGKVYNGLPLSHVDWAASSTGQSVRGYTEGTPGPYSAVAYYKGVQSYVVATEYTASVTYLGEATKEMVTGQKVAAKYIGEPEASSAKKGFPLLPVVALSSLICAGGIMGLIYFFRKKRMVIK